MKAEDTEHYVASACNVIVTAMLCYFYWSHLPSTRQEELRRWARGMVDGLRAQLREQRVGKMGQDWLEALWRRSA